MGRRAYPSTRNDGEPVPHAPIGFPAVMSMSPVRTLDPAAVAAEFGDLPTLAPVAVEVLRLTDDDAATLDDIALAIRNDPGLAGQLLKVANSPMYGMGGEVASLSRAASILGLRTVKLLSLSFAVVASTNGSNGDALIWRRTLAASALSQTIANRFDRRLVDEVFISSLLANIGRLALLNDPDYRAANRGAGGWLDAPSENELVGTTSDLVTAEILDLWGLPTHIAEAIRYRSEPTTADGIAREVARMLHIADVGAGFIIANEDFAPAALEQWCATVKRDLRLGEEAADGLLTAAQQQLETIAGLFNTDAADQNVSDLVYRARQRMARLSLDVVAALSQEQSRAASLAADNELLSAQVLTDPLTKLPNRRAFDQEVKRAICGHDRGTHTGRLAVMVLDLDHFKTVNDTFGHQVGDEVLVQVSRRLQSRCRANEFVARMGGEEFAVVLPSTNPDEALRAADGYRKAVNATPIETSAGRLDVTTSAGVATSDRITDETPEELYQRADRALYDAKHNGRNCVRSAD